MNEINGIKLVRILPADYPLFRQFDPLNTIDMMVLPESFALGAIDEGRYAGTTTLAGLMTVTTAADRLIIEWLAVDQEYRDMEIGSALCDTLFEAAKETGIPKVCARFEEGESSVSESWFKDGFFTEEEEIPGVYRVETGIFVSKGKLTKKAKPDTVKPLSKLSAAARAKIQEFDQKAAISYKHGDIASVYGLCDKDFSCAYMEGDEIKGIMLVISIEDRHYPLLLAAESNEVIEDMIVYSAHYADDNLSIGDKLIIFCDTEDTHTLVKHYIGDTGYIKRKYLYGNVAEFEAESTAASEEKEEDNIEAAYDFDDDDDIEEYLFDIEDFSDDNEDEDEDFDEDFDDDEEIDGDD